MTDVPWHFMVLLLVLGAGLLVFLSIAGLLARQCWRRTSNGANSAWLPLGSGRIGHYALVSESRTERLWDAFTSDGVGGYLHLSTLLAVHILLVGGIVGCVLCIVRGETGDALRFAALGAAAAPFCVLIWRLVLREWRRDAR